MSMKRCMEIVCNMEQTAVLKHPEGYQHLQVRYRKNMLHSHLSFVLPRKPLQLHAHGQASEREGIVSVTTKNDKSNKALQPRMTNPALCAENSVTLSS